MLVNRIRFTFALLCGLAVACQTPQQSLKQGTTQQVPLEQSFNEGWQFVRDVDTTNAAVRLSGESFAQVQWEEVSLPHTARLEAIEKTEQQWQGDAFYRKTFTVPAADKGRHIALKFEAAMQVADVYLNGQHVFRHLGGYLPFYVNLSDVVKFGEANTLLVKLNNQDNPDVPPGKPLADLDFNYYSGLYRNVYLVTKDKLHISDPIAANQVAGGGVLLHYTTATKGQATLEVQTEIKNDHQTAKQTQVRLLLQDEQGNTLAETVSEEVNVQPGTFGKFQQDLSIANPHLWSPEQPYLYTLTVELLQDGKVLDRQLIKTGARSYRFSADGFYLNGQRYFLRGTNRHQEYPYVGYALSDNARYRDAYKIKEAGFNFVRSSHYPQSPAFLAAADEIGLFVMDAIPGWQFFGSEAYQQQSLQNVRDMVRRDRNHPSIIAWEASLNESGMSKEFMEATHRAVHEELPYPDTYTSGWINYAYDLFIPARQHAKAPDYWNKYSKGKPLLIAEYGDWEYYAQNAGFNQTAYADLTEEARTSRQLRGFGQQRLLQQALNYQEAHNSNLQGPAVGDANWLMYDYKRGYAPDIESSGIMDIVRLPKFAYYFYQSQAGPSMDEGAVFKKPMIFIANYWNDPQLKTVKVYSNTDEVELRLNGKIIARQKPDQDKFSTHLKHPPFTFEVPVFEPGTLTAIGFIKGHEVVQEKQSTPGKPTGLKLQTDISGRAATAGVNDVLFVYAHIIDENGTTVPDATPQVQFDVVAGDAEVVYSRQIAAEAGIAAILLKVGKSPGEIKIRASSAGLESAITTIPVQLSEKGNK